MGSRPPLLHLGELDALTFPPSRVAGGSASDLLGPIIASKERRLKKTAEERHVRVANGVL